MTKRNCKLSRKWRSITAKRPKHRLVSNLPAFLLSRPEIPDITSPRPQSRVPTRPLSHVPERPHVPCPQARVPVSPFPFFHNSAHDSVREMMEKIHKTLYISMSFSAAFKWNVSL